MPFEENPDAIVSSTDEIIGGIFGSGWQNLLVAPAEQGTTGSILGGLLSVFSIGIIGITVFIVGIVFMTALAETANKGRIGGDYSNMWLPIRSVLAPVLIFPIANGYSLIQMMLLAGVVNIPIQLADVLMVNAAETIVMRGQAFSNPSVAQVAGVGNQVMYSEICRSYYNNIEYPNRRTSDYIRAPQTPSLSTAIRGSNVDGPIFDLSYPRINGIGFAREYQCGSYRIECQQDDSASQSMCLQQARSLHQMMEEYRVLADDFVINRNTPNFRQFASIQARYQESIKQAVGTRVLANLTEEDLNERRQFIEHVKRDGFFGAGKYYMTLTQISQHNASLGQPNTVIQPFDLVDSIDAEVGIGIYLARASKFMGGRTTGISGETTITGFDAAFEKEKSLARIGHRLSDNPDNRLASYVGDGISSVVNEAVDTALYNEDPLAGADLLEFRHAFDYDEEPITGIQSLGNTLITVSSAYFAGSAVAGFIPMGKFGKYLDKLYPSSGQNEKSGLGFILGGIGMLMTVAFFLGAVLLYYIPSVPYIIWTMGCIGYLITIFETLLAATIWIASHVMPSGQGLSSDHSRQGYGLLINLAIRPPVMVIGLFGGAAVMHVGVAYFVEGYHTYAVGLMSNRLDFTGLLTWIFLTAIEVSLIIAIIHKTHSAIFEAPDRVVQWITSQTRPTGEDQAESKVAGVFQQTASRGEGVAAGAAQASQTKTNNARQLYNK